MSQPRERPSNIPADAFWDDDAWALGPKTADGQRIGDWSYWTGAGALLCQERWGDATTRLTYQRFHPDGTLAQEGAKDLARDRWTGTMRWIRGPERSPENASFPATAGDEVRTYEVDLDDDGLVISERSFDAAGRPLTQGGEPLPRRPANVSPLAFMTDDGWILQRRTLTEAHQIGEEQVHDRNGVLVTRTWYEPPGQIRDRETYQRGALWSSEHRTPEGDRLVSYYSDADPPRRSQSTLYRDGENDRTLTHYDPSGAVRFCVRMQQQGLHTRRYDDGRLVFESIRPEDPAQPPIKVAYYELDGRPLVDYRSAGDGTGTWILRAADGGPPLELPETEEASRNKYGNWGRFLRGFGRYDDERRDTDPEHVREQFRAAWDELAAQRRLDALPLPPEVAAVLQTVDWEELDSAMGLKDLARATWAVLADDDEIAGHGLDDLWFEIEHQGSIYEATYEIATALATLLPLQAGRPAVERRLFDLLHEVLSLEGIVVDDRKRYARLAAALAGSVPLFHGWSQDPDDATALPAQHLLARATAGTAAGERLAYELIEAATTPVRRAYAACVLWCVLPRKPRPAALTALFVRESSAPVRFAIAMLMLYSGADHPQLADVIEAAIADPEPFTLVFDELRPFLEGDVLEYLIGVLPAATLERHADRMIDRLVDAGSLAQINYLDAVFRVLFADGLPTRPTPTQQRALRAVADVVDAHPGFVNHMEVFDRHEIPHDSFTLRELADKKPGRARGR